jgi:hypothetical protein
MKKLCIALLLLPSVSFAESVNFFGVHYATVNGNSDEISANGYKLDYKRVYEGFSAGLDYTVIDFEHSLIETKDREQEVNASLDFGFSGSFDTGILYVGLGAEMYNGSNQNYLVKFGAAKRSGEGLDFDFNLSSQHGDIILGGSLQGPIGNSSIRWEAGFTHFETTTATAGFSLPF